MAPAAAARAHRVAAARARWAIVSPGAGRRARRPAGRAAVGSDTNAGLLRLARRRPRRATARRSRTRPAAERALRSDTTAGVAWLDILHDTTLERLVRTALRAEPHRAVGRRRASASIRAEAGVARAPLLPNVSINGSESTNQMAFGSHRVSAIDAARVTGDVSWELDFWGEVPPRRTRPRTPMLAAQDAAERAVVLSLVSDVATGYLQLLELDQERAIAERTLASRRATLDLARQRFARGVISELDVRQFEAQVAAPAVTLAQIERAGARCTEHSLNVLLGEAPAPHRARAGRSRRR